MTSTKHLDVLNADDSPAYCQTEKTRHFGNEKNKKRELITGT